MSKGRNPFETIDKALIADSSMNGMLAKDLLYLCDRIGPRFAGTPAYRRAADFMLDRFRACGLENAHLEPFEFLAWRRGEVGRMAITVPCERPVACVVLPYGGATPKGGVTAEIVDVGAGAEEDLLQQAERIKGRIVMSTSTSRHRTEVYKQAAELGAVGFVMAGTASGGLLPTGSVADGESTTIAAVGITFEDAASLGRLMEQGPVTVSLEVDATVESDVTWNVVGELVGTETPNEWVIMGGHLDSHDIGPCAFDNGAGAITVLETARLLSKQRKHLKRSVRFIGFAGEEIGLLGSHHHASAHAEELQNAWFMLNSDCPSSGKPHGIAFHKWTGAETYVSGLGDAFNGKVPTSQRFHCHSDHYPFMLQGVPTGAVTGTKPRSTGGAYYHTAADTIDKLFLDDMQDAACFAARLLLRIASDPAWPRARRSDEQVEELHAAR